VSGDGLLAPAGDVRIEMTSLTGDLSSDLDGKHLTERGRRAFTIGSNGPVVTFRSMSGDLHVARPSLVGHPVGNPVEAAAPPPVERAPANRAIAAAYDDARLRILRSLERGEIDVAEASRRLETLDAGDVPVPAATEDESRAVATSEERRANG
jgi:hypothetical protein